MTSTNYITVSELPAQLSQIINRYIEEYDPLIVVVDDFSEQTIDRIISDLEIKIADTPKKLRKRIFQITVELIQNIYRHSNVAPPEIAENYKKFGFYILSKISNFAYKITVGNFVKEQIKQYLETYLNTIKTLNQNELKEYYYQILNNKSFTTQGGGGLGFIEIAKKSNSNFDFKFIKYNLDLYLFIYNVTISIENQ